MTNVSFYLKTTNEAQNAAPGIPKQMRKEKELVESEKGRDHVHVGFQLKETRKGDPGVNMNHCTQGKHSQAGRKKHDTSQEQVERFSFTLRSSFGRHGFGLYR